MPILDTIWFVWWVSSLQSSVVKSSADRTELRCTLISIESFFHYGPKRSSSSMLHRMHLDYTELWFLRPGISSCQSRSLRYSSERYVLLAPTRWLYLELGRKYLPPALCFSSCFSASGYDVLFHHSCHICNELEVIRNYVRTFSQSLNHQGAQQARKYEWWSDQPTLRTVSYILLLPPYKDRHTRWPSLRQSKMSKYQFIGLVCQITSAGSHIFQNLHGISSTSASP